LLFKKRLKLFNHNVKLLLLAELEKLTSPLKEWDGTPYTALIKKNRTFSSYLRKIQKGSGAKPNITNGLLIYD
jgi:hypothetical protein